MALSVKSSGVWRTATRIYAKSGGVWRDCQKVFIRSGGVWQLAFQAFKMQTTLTPGLSPGGQTNYKGYSTNPVVGSIGTTTVDGYTIELISESPSGGATLQVYFVTGVLNSNIISKVTYGTSETTGFVTPPYISGTSSVYYFNLNARSMVVGTPVTITFS